MMKPSASTRAMSPVTYQSAKQFRAIQILAAEITPHDVGAGDEQQPVLIDCLGASDSGCLGIHDSQPRCRAADGRPSRFSCRSCVSLFTVLSAVVDADDRGEFRCSRSPRPAPRRISRGIPSITDGGSFSAPQTSRRIDLEVVRSATP